MGCSWGLFLVVVLPTFHLGVCHTGFNLPPGKNGLGVVLGGEAGGGGGLGGGASYPPPWDSSYRP